MSNVTNIVASQWKKLGEELQTDESIYYDVHKAAIAKKNLAQLYPFVGVAGFGFSKVTEYPFFVDVLISHTDSNQFAVRVGSGDGGWADTEQVGQGDPTTCVAIASEILPNDYGEAILGNANDWRRLKGMPLVGE